MKQTTFLILNTFLISLFTFTSCEKDDNSSSCKISGTWKLQYTTMPNELFQYIIDESGQIVGSEIIVTEINCYYSCATESELPSFCAETYQYYYNCPSITINNNGTYSSRESGSNIETTGNWTGANGNNINCNEGGEFNWILDGDVNQGEILSISANELVLRNTNYSYPDYEGNNVYPEFYFSRN